MPTATELTNSGFCSLEKLGEVGGNGEIAGIAHGMWIPPWGGGAVRACPS